MTNVTNGSVMFNGVTSIDDSGLDGVLVTMDNVANGSIDFFGPTEITKSGSRGIDINVLDGTNLVNNNPLGLMPIEVLTLTNNQPPTAFNNFLTQLPAPGVNQPELAGESSRTSH